MHNYGTSTWQNVHFIQSDKLISLACQNSTKINFVAKIKILNNFALVV